MAEADASRLYQLADDVSRGSLLIPIVKVMPLDQVREAQQEAEEGHLQGKDHFEARRLIAVFFVPEAGALFRSERALPGDISSAGIARARLPGFA